MNTASWIVLISVLAITAFVLYRMILNKKRGKGGCGCSSGCGGCAMRGVCRAQKQQ